MTKPFRNIGPSRKVAKAEREEKRREKRERKRRAKEEKLEPVRFGEPMGEKT